MNSEKPELTNPTLQISPNAQKFFEEKGNEDAKTNIIVSSNKFNSDMNKIYENVGKQKFIQQQKLKDGYTKDYIEASNRYTE